LCLKIGLYILNRFVPYLYSSPVRHTIQGSFFDYVLEDFPTAERFYSMEISLPIYVGLSEQD
ncbi:MAG: hypothetical protein EOM02_12345, partial [Synergistales bacterium]|nr:hypothetical protein [Synergistales bacterium]